MNDLDKLLEFLDEKLRDHDPSPPQVSRWLARVSAQERCIQLAACMGMDLLMGAIAAPVVAGLVSRAEALGVVHATLTASELFQLALTEHPQEKLLCSHPAAEDQRYEGEYVRVLDFVDFLEFYARYTAITPAKLQQAYRIYPDGTPLGFVRNPWQGKLPVVWVTTHDELTSIIKEEGEDLPGTRVARRFGLGNPTNTLGSSPEYVAIRYPVDAPVKGCKPTCLDQVWNNDHRFVSCETPHWGATLPYPPDQDGVRERVHLALDSGLSDSYTLQHLGKCVVPEQTKEVAQIALRRFLEYPRR